MNGRRSFRHAVKWAYVMTLGQRGIALILTFVLAAILGPKDFGVVAMAMAYILFIEMLVAQGMGAAIIQRRELTSDHLDSVFWLIVAASLILAGVSVALSPWWAAVNDLPELTAVIRVLSLSIPIKGLTVVQHALLQRKMDFRSLALLTGASSVVGGAVGVSLALTGCGVWSLVAQQLTDSAAAALVMWAVSGWRPRLRFSVRRARELLGFSGGVFASQLGVYTAAQADAVLMGIFFGPLAVGLYRLADRLVRVLLEVATRSIQIVSLPHFSSLQDEPERLKDAVLTCIRLSATITIPAMAILAAVGDELMALLGEKWAPSAAVLPVLVIMGSTKAITLFAGPLLLAKGRAKTVAALVWLLSVATAAGILAVGAGMKHAATEAQVVAVALVRTGLFVILHGVVSIIITSKLCRIPARQFATALAPG
ncbi:MAG: lipopolysaccharide biosynthesis protein, partial [Phycisphaerales bacterium]